jgi:replication fork protection complex subunit Tof1/Swi1
LSETFDLISKFEFNPPSYEDDQSAEDLIRSSAAAARAAERNIRKAAFDDDSDGGIDYDEDINLGEYGAGGPTARKSEGLDETKKKRRLKKHRNTIEEGEETDEETRARREARNEKRKLKKLDEKQKFKSTVYVHDSDDEDDEEKDREFFAAEEERRKNAGTEFAKVLSKVKKDGARKSTGKKRKSVSPEASASEADEEPQKRKKARKALSVKDGNDDIVAISSDSSSSHSDNDIDSPKKADAEMADTPISSQVHGGSSDAEPAEKVVSSTKADVSMKNVTDDEEDDALPVRSTARRRGGFVIESDDED